MGLQQHCFKLLWAQCATFTGNAAAFRVHPAVELFIEYSERTHPEHSEQQEANEQPKPGVKPGHVLTNGRCFLLVHGLGLPRKINHDCAKQTKQQPFGT